MRAAAQEEKPQCKGSSEEQQQLWAQAGQLGGGEKLRCAGAPCARDSAQRARRSARRREDSRLAASGEPRRLSRGSAATL